MTPPLWREALRTLAAVGIRGPELAELCVLLSGLGVPPGLRPWFDVQTRLLTGVASLEPKVRLRHEHLAKDVVSSPSRGLALWLLVLAIDGGDVEARSAVFSEANPAASE